MSPHDWWLEADSKIEQHKTMSNGLGGRSQSDWDKARKAHREKMKAKANG
jgi:hypothetical protein